MKIKYAFMGVATAAMLAVAVAAPWNAVPETAATHADVRTQVGCFIVPAADNPFGVPGMGWVRQDWYLTVAGTGARVYDKEETGMLGELNDLGAFLAGWPTCQVLPQGWPDPTLRPTPAPTPTLIPALIPAPTPEMSP